jgi:hypothetical protein
LALYLSSILTRFGTHSVPIEAGHEAHRLTPKTLAAATIFRRMVRGMRGNAANNVTFSTWLCGRCFRLEQCKTALCGLEQLEVFGRGQRFAVQIGSAEKLD